MINCIIYAVNYVNYHCHLPDAHR